VNSIERVRAAVDRRPVDKVPLGFYLVDYDTVQRVIGHETYVRNNIATRIAMWEGRRDEVVESYKKDSVEFYQKMDLADLIVFKEAPVVPPRGWQPDDPPKRVSDGVWRDSQGRVWKYSEMSNDFVLVEDPTPREEFTVERYAKEIDDSPPDPTIFEAFDYLVAHLGHDRYIGGYSGGLRVFGMLGYTERNMMSFLLEPEAMKAAIDYWRRWGNAMDQYFIRPGQSGVFIEEDSGGTNGPMVSPAMYREFSYPAMKSRVQSIKRYTDQVLMHNCGDNRPLIDMFIDAGIMCYQSLQTNAGMYIPDLQDKWGDRMAFWGGVATDLLVGGTAEEVRANVRDVMTKAGPRGGFILGPSHSIAFGTKYDNFMAMLDEFDRLRERCASQEE
jgi:uroporphyrinogen-III decarboxylase